MIKYLGSKRVLLGPIVAAVRGLGPDVRSALDLFSGTARVGHALKKSGLFVTANDHLTYAATLAAAYVAADARVWAAPARALLAELAAIPAGPEGWFTRQVAREARYLQPHNAARVEAIREAIAARALPAPLEAIALTSLMEAADRVDSTAGVQMAYLKSWAARSHNALELRVPALLAGEGAALQLDARDAAATEADVAYLDPPYNQHSYLGNYHVWETLARWDAPETYGVANKRVECKTYKNAFNSRVRIGAALAEVIARVRAPELVVSFSDEGFLAREELEAMLGARGHVRVVAARYERYVGAKIGIYDPKGNKVGRPSHLENTEMIFIVSPERARAEAAAARCLAALGERAAGAASAAGTAGTNVQLELPLR
ncbi:MAG: DNA adenine methylase [Sandaracinaceae bacterium]|nr:DNA adenine methylase [Sandaracinaceae bacterium]